MVDCCRLICPVSDEAKDKLPPANIERTKVIKVIKKITDDEDEDNNKLFKLQSLRALNELLDKIECLLFICLDFLILPAKVIMFGSSLCCCFADADADAIVVVTTT